MVISLLFLENKPLKIIGEDQDLQVYLLVILIEELLLFLNQVNIIVFYQHTSESLYISQYISQHNKKKNILAGIDYHSYSQLVLRPYGWTNNKCPDEVALKILGDGISYEISRFNFIFKI